METRLTTQLQVEEEKSKKRVMVAMDESSCSSHALEWALQHLILSQSPEPVVLYHVQSPATLSCVPPATYGPARIFTAMSVTPELIRSLKETQKRMSMELLERAAHLCARYGVATEIVTEIGEPKESICSAVDKFKINLLILGSHGKGVIQRAFLGSVSNYCIHNAECAVLVVKKDMM